MGKFKIGVMAESFRLPMADALAAARRIGADGVQLTVSHGELAYDGMTDGRVEWLLGLLRENGLEVSALNGDFGGHGFARADETPARVEKTKRVIDLAVKLGTRIVTTHAGVIPSNPSDARYATLQTAFREVGAYAAGRGVTLAIETGPESPETLRAFLESLGGAPGVISGVGVNLDPANFVMVTGEDPARAVRLLAPYIVHTHAKDGVMLKKTDPQILYDFFAEGGIEDLRIEEYFTEKPLGQGAVDFDAYLAELSRAGFSGYLTVERETGADPASDIELAVRFLSRFANENA
ncbi:MAG: sugar phosphate isomerase/epimerase [Clostridiales bacterium]|jgi:sugar phosphate isomerase/epimerase|nr:sugar phosphate isomerase/epimerase [Clostridiales bacterium]